MFSSRILLGRGRTPFTSAKVDGERVHSGHPVIVVAERDVNR